MIEYFMECAPDGKCVQVLLWEMPPQSPIEPADPANTLVPIDAPPLWVGRTPTEALYMIDGQPVWVETASLPELQQWAADQIDAAGEDTRAAMMNRMPTQTEEYRQVLQQAQAWRAAGYPETDEQPAPPDIACWALAKWRDGWTARQAADDILAAADRWAAVISQIRMLRLVNKENVRHATDTESVVAIVSDVRADMRAMAHQMNLTITE